MAAILLSVFLIYPPGQEVAQIPKVVIADDTNGNHSKTGNGRLNLQGGETISVTSFTFEGNTMITSADLERLTNPYLNRPLAQADVESVTGRIKALYSQQSHPGVDVYALAVKPNSHALTIIIKEKPKKKS